MSPPSCFFFLEKEIMTRTPKRTGGEIVGCEFLSLNCMLTPGRPGGYELVWRISDHSKFVFITEH